MRILQSGPAAKPVTATVAQVTFSERGGFGAVSAAEQRSIPIFGPRGISYRPCEGDNILLLTTDGSTVCAGVLCSTEGLAAGELQIAASSGAMVHLREDGSISLNGLIITKNGRILPPEQEE